MIETGGATRVLTAGPGGDLVTITDGDVVSGGAVSRWRVAADGGVLDPDLLADRPAEERARAAWSVRWAVPVDAGGASRVRAAGDGVSAVVHAPTPTDEPLGLPALLLASFPLSPDRRHVAPGPLTDFLVERAADVYAGMLPGLRARARPARPGAGAGRAGRAGRAAGPRDRRPAAGRGVPAGRRRGGGARESGRATRCCWRAAPRRWPTGSRRCCPAWSTGPAGTRRSRCSGCGGCRWPSWPTCSPPSTGSRPGGAGCTRRWRTPRPQDLAELGALPVPLADGRLVRGPRGLLLPGAAASSTRTGWRVLGLRVVAPEAAHPLLVRLGGFEATPRTVLEDAATRAAVAASYDAAVEAGYDDDRPERVADAVLGLVAALNAEPGDYPYLADLALPGDDGDWYPAGELLLPGSPLAEVIAATRRSAPSTRRRSTATARGRWRRPACCPRSAC